MNEWQKLGRSLSCVVALLPGQLFGQSDSLTQARPAGAIDSAIVQHWRDSLEVSLLRTTQTYAHVEQILRVVPPKSLRFDLLPSVLPIDAPIEAFRITSPFGLRKHPVTRQAKLHAGVDVKALPGTIVKATAPGVVASVGYDPALGAFVRVEHAFGFETVYGHLQGYCVQPGQCIALNEEVGKVGRTGLVTGPHLHYSIKKNGSVIDPFQFCFLLRRRLALVEHVDAGTVRKNVQLNRNTHTRAGRGKPNRG